MIAETIPRPKTKIDHSRGKFSSSALSTPMSEKMMVRRDCNSAIMGMANEEKRKMATTTLEVGEFYEQNKNSIDSKKKLSHNDGGVSSTNSFFKSRQTKNSVVPLPLRDGAPKRSSSIFRISLGQDVRYYNSFNIFFQDGPYKKTSIISPPIFDQMQVVESSGHATSNSTLGP
jgi:hypothetical protein